MLLSGTTTNQNEGDRRQFEAQLKGYYALADATADRLTNYVYALAAAVACEELSLAATQALLELPVNPGQPGNAPLNETELILTGFGNVSPPANFGVPAAYFYALGVLMPTQITPSRRYQLAIRDKIDHLLAELTSAINAGTVTDSERFASLPAAIPAINAAQAARATRRPEHSGRIDNGARTPGHSVAFDQRGYFHWKRAALQLDYRSHYRHVGERHEYPEQHDCLGAHASVGDVEPGRIGRCADRYRRHLHPRLYTRPATTCASVAGLSALARGVDVAK